MEFDIVYLDMFHADEAEQYGQTVYLPSFEQVPLRAADFTNDTNWVLAELASRGITGIGVVEAEPIPADVMDWFASTLSRPEPILTYTLSRPTEWPYSPSKWKVRMAADYRRALYQAVWNSRQCGTVDGRAYWTVRSETLRRNISRLTGGKVRW